MEYSVVDTQHQTYSSANGVSKVVTFTVEYRDADFKNTSYLEFGSDALEEEIVKAIEDHGKALMAESEKTYSFAKSGVIE